MDSFQRFASEFKEYCEGKLHLLLMVSSVVEDSETVGTALRKLFFQSSVCPGDYDQISSLPLEIDRLRNCIDSIEVKPYADSIAFFDSIASHLSLIHRK
jgi:hypothetical protein